MVRTVSFFLAVLAYLAVSNALGLFYDVLSLATFFLTCRYSSVVKMTSCSAQGNVYRSV